MTWRRTFLTTAAALFACVAAVPQSSEPAEVASRTTFYVSRSAAKASLRGDGTTSKAKQSIQAAIDAASSGDTIIVDPGTYFENIQFNAKDITLRSTAPGTPSVVASTIIDGGGLSSVVTFSGSEGNTCLLSGFTIRNGRFTDGAGIHGGTTGASATISFNVIENNVATGVSGVSGGYAGGIFNCDGLIRGNTIRNNSALGNAGSPSAHPGTGGGMSHCGGIIELNIIHNNSAGYGGGMALCDALIQGNIIHTNEAQFDGGGLTECDDLIHNSMIYDNQAARGAGIAWCNGDIENNTFYRNNATQQGGGLYSCDGTAVITNCILYENTALVAGPQLHTCNVPTYSLVQSGTARKQGNFSADPQFVNSVARDLHILPTSPCVDAGTSAVGVVLDFEWQTRPTNGTTEPRGDGSDYDIGADEYVPPTHQLTVTVIGSGTIDPPAGTHDVPVNDSVSIAATADANWFFERWQGDFAGDANPLEFAMDRSRNVIATFVSETSLTVSGTVEDARTGIPLMDVQVQLFEADNSTAADTDTTDSVGDFTLIAPNTYRPLKLTFSRDGYDPAERTGFHAPTAIYVAMIPSFPSPPEDLVGRAGPDEALLKWRPSPEYDVAGYNVYRALSGTKITSLLNTDGLVRRTRYRDATAIAAQTYAYYVTAVDAGGNESTPSNTANVTAGVIEVRLPDLVQAPSGVVRIPISVRNATGINPFGMDFNFTYPQSLVDLTVVGGSVTAGVTVEQTAITSHMRFVANTTQPGRVRISGIDPAGIDTLSGEGHLFDIVFTMRNDVTAGSCGPLSFPDFLDQSVLRSGVTFYDSTPAPIATDYTDTGLLCVLVPSKQDCLSCAQGDLTCDGVIDSDDVLLALQMAAGIVAPSECEVYAGDFNGDGQIDSADALMIQRISGGLQVNPGEEDDTLADLLDPGAPVTVSLAQVVVHAGESAEIPVSIDDATGIAGAEFTLAYPPELEALVVAVGDLTASFIAEGAFEPGVVRITMSAEAALAGGSGNLALLSLQVADNLPANESLPITISDVALKGQFGDSFEWYADIEMSHGEILIVADSDVNGDTAVDAVDVQLVINGVLGTGSGDVDTDVDGDGETNAVDVQLVINSALGLTR